MPVRLESQTEMQKARRALARCYLCGEPLPSVRNASHGVIAEHVIPKALLGSPPDHRAWPVVLDVHRACEVAHKRERDQLNATLQRLNTTPVEEWPDPGQVRRLPLVPVVIDDARSVRPQSALSGAADLLDGARTWIRGLHAALYRELLDPADEIVVCPPVPAAGPPGGLPIAATEEIAFASVASVQAALLSNAWDGIVAWGGKLKYRCTWFLKGSTTADPTKPWICFWTLEFPGVLEWSATVDAPIRPWNGHHGCREAPRDAARLTQRELDVLNRHLAGPCAADS